MEVNNSKIEFFNLSETPAQVIKFEELIPPFTENSHVQSLSVFFINNEKQIIINNEDLNSECTMEEIREYASSLIDFSIKNFCNLTELVVIEISEALNYLALDPLLSKTKPVLGDSKINLKNFSEDLSYKNVFRTSQKDLFLFLEAVRRIQLLESGFLPIDNIDPKTIFVELISEMDTSWAKLKGDLMLTIKLLNGNTKKIEPLKKVVKALRFFRSIIEHNHRNMFLPFLYKPLEVVVQSIDIPLRLTLSQSIKSSISKLEKCRKVAYRAFEVYIDCFKSSKEIIEKNFKIFKKNHQGEDKKLISLLNIMIQKMENSKKKLEFFKKFESNESYGKVILTALESTDKSLDFDCLDSTILTEMAKSLNKCEKIYNKENNNFLDFKDLDDCLENIISCASPLTANKKIKVVLQGISFVFNKIFFNATYLGATRPLRFSISSIIFRENRFINCMNYINELMKLLENEWASVKEDNFLFDNSYRLKCSIVDSLAFICEKSSYPKKEEILLKVKEAMESIPLMIATLRCYKNDGTSKEEYDDVLSNVFTNIFTLICSVENCVSEISQYHITENKKERKKTREEFEAFREQVVAFLEVNKLLNKINQYKKIWRSYGENKLKEEFIYFLMKAKSPKKLDDKESQFFIDKMIPNCINIFRELETDQTIVKIKESLSYSSQDQEATSLYFLHSTFRFYLNRVHSFGSLVSTIENFFKNKDGAGVLSSQEKKEMRKLFAKLRRWRHDMHIYRGLHLLSPELLNYLGVNSEDLSFFEEIKKYDTQFIQSQQHLLMVVFPFLEMWVEQSASRTVKASKKIENKKEESLSKISLISAEQEVLPLEKTSSEGSSSEEVYDEDSSSEEILNEIPRQLFLKQKSSNEIILDEETSNKISFDNFKVMKGRKKGKNKESSKKIIDQEISLWGKASLEMQKLHSQLCVLQLPTEQTAKLKYYRWKGFETSMENLSFNFKMIDEILLFKDKAPKIFERVFSQRKHLALEMLAKCLLSTRPLPAFEGSDQHVLFFRDSESKPLSATHDLEKINDYLDLKIFADDIKATKAVLNTCYLGDIQNSEVDASSEAQSQFLENCKIFINQEVESQKKNAVKSYSKMEIENFKMMLKSCDQQEYHADKKKNSQFVEKCADSLRSIRLLLGSLEEKSTLAQHAKLRIEYSLSLIQELMANAAVMKKYPALYCTLIADINMMLMSNCLHLCLFKKGILNDEVKINDFRFMKHCHNPLELWNELEKHVKNEDSKLYKEHMMKFSLDSRYPYARQHENAYCLISANQMPSGKRVKRALPLLIGAEDDLILCMEMSLKLLYINLVKV